jgi:hypothetical protein
MRRRTLVDREVVRARGERAVRQLGNLPHASSHLALIEAAARIIVAEQLEEVMG